MKTLIVFATTHGCTEQCALKVCGGLKNEAEPVNLKQNSKIDPAAFDAVIIGGSIHAGRIQKRVKKFCDANQNVLLTKKLGLFLCCMDKDLAQKQFDSNFPETLRKHATAKGIFGGKFDFEKMNFMAKAIVKKAAGVTESVSTISDEAMGQFIKDMQE